VKSISTKKVWIVWLGILAGSLSVVMGQGSPPVFTSIQPGQTQMVVTVAVPSWTCQVMLESRTNAQTGGWRPAAVQTITNLSVVSLRVDKSGPMKLLRARADAVPTFVGRADRCIGLIKAAYGNVQLLSVQATCTFPTIDPDDLSSLKVICSLPDYNIAYVESTNPFTYGPVTYVPNPWVGVNVIPWLPGMDVNEADQLLKAAGYTGTYGAISMYQPVYPGMNEPYYIFNMTGGTSVYVGVDSRQVFH